MEHDVAANDPYELKLFQMFQSCDLEQKGYLNEESLRRLCSMLELRDKGNILIKTLPSDEVSFEHFKEALLSFLGSELDKAGHGNGNSTASQQQSHRLNGSSGGDCGDYIKGNHFCWFYSLKYLKIEGGKCFSLFSRIVQL